MQNEEFKIYNSVFYVNNNKVLKSLKLKPKLKKIAVKPIFLITGSLLLIPAFAMMFTSEVNWGPLDFLVAAVLLLSFGFAGILVWNKIHTKIGRIILITILVLTFILIWLELAVGVFNSFFAGS